MTKVLRVLVALPGVLFLVLGLRWIVDPAAAAAALGMPLLVGVGRSTQIGDLSAFFLTLAVTILVGAITARKVWLYAPMLLLALAALVRILAWLLHDAALATHLILPELIIAGLLWLASTRLGDRA